MSGGNASTTIRVADLVVEHALGDRTSGALWPARSCMTRR